MLDAQFNESTFPSQGAYIVSTYTNIFIDRIHLDYLYSLSHRLIVIGSEPIVHPVIRTHYPKALTFHTTDTDSYNGILLNGHLSKTPMSQSIRTFTKHSAFRTFKLQWGTDGMRWLTKQTDATIWNRTSYVRSGDMHTAVYWFSLLPNPVIENFVLDNAINVC